MPRTIEDNLYKAICQYLKEQPAVVLFTELMQAEVAFERQASPEEIASRETKPAVALETK